MPRRRRQGEVDRGAGGAGEVERGAVGGEVDVTRNEVGVSVGIHHNTKEFTVSTIRQWWQ
ncbi:MAG: hypothetical protein EPO40_18705 [Myxococcaceae bacterium]|nr:MAG: hypothetical protein EPO40_18705 [Myxococcaceae bacterium]